MCIERVWKVADNTQPTCCMYLSLLQTLSHWYHCVTQLLTEEEHQRFLEMRLSIAESRTEDSFHCQTPNCRGWCIYEDEVNEFDCELCGETNCILCRVGFCHFVLFLFFLTTHGKAPDRNQVVSVCVCGCVYRPSTVT